jgi:hypothetical protein
LPRWSCAGGPKKSVKRQIEIQPRLFAVGDDVQSGRRLIVNGREDGVFLQLRAIGLAELIEMLAGEFQPAGKRVTANDCGSQRLFFHNG